MQTANIFKTSCEIEKMNLAILSPHGFVAHSQTAVAAAFAAIRGCGSRQSTDSRTLRPPLQPAPAAWII